MAFTLNGIGTSFYGVRWLPDGTYITTKWIVFCFVPLLPTGSVRIIKASESYGAAILYGQSLTVQSVPLDKVMVLKVYGWIAGGVVGMFLLSEAGHWVGL